MAARAGAMIADPEFVQFHPTAVDIGRDPAPLATEALRGEGAHLINRDGTRFMLAVHPSAELAPRDVVARAVFAEIAAGRGALLDCRAAIGERVPRKIPDRLPGVHVRRHRPAHGADPHRAGRALPHGRRLDRWPRPHRLQGLWACGEVAATGVHGANRLASNSLLEAVVFAARIADDIRATLPVGRTEPAAAVAGDNDPEPAAADVRRLRRAMTDNVGVIRNGAGLRAALAVIGDLEATSVSTRFHNTLAAARLIAAAALARTESRGGHYRSDYPRASGAQRHRTFMTLAEARSGPAQVPAAGSCG